MELLVKKVKVLTSAGFVKIETDKIKRNDIFQVEPGSMSYTEGSAESLNRGLRVFQALGKLNPDGTIVVFPFIRSDLCELKHQQAVEEYRTKREQKI